MSYFDEVLWEQIGKRLQRVMPKDWERFAMDHHLKGVRIDRIIRGRKGTSVETLVRICLAADISPTWLVLGRGLIKLSEVGKQRIALADLIKREKNLKTKEKMIDLKDRIMKLVDSPHKRREALRIAENLLQEYINVHKRISALPTIAVNEADEPPPS